MSSTTSTDLAPAAPARRFARLRVLRLVAMVLLIALLAAGAIRALVIQSFSVPTASMAPTIPVGSTVYAWRPDALLGSIEPGDIVVFDGRGSFVNSLPPTSGQQLASWFGLGNKDVYYVKRVIGVGGDTVKCCNSRGQILRNGQALDEPYVKEPSATAQVPFNVQVPAGRLWLMGDNRADSTDSRNLLGRPGGGMIPQSRVLGTVLGHGASVG